jgi:hypothetical protein
MTQNLLDLYPTIRFRTAHFIRHLLRCDDSVTVHSTNRSQNPSAPITKRIRPALWPSDRQYALLPIRRRLILVEAGFTLNTRIHGRYAAYEGKCGRNRGRYVTYFWKKQRQIRWWYARRAFGGLGIGHGKRTEQYVKAFTWYILCLLFDFPNARIPRGWMPGPSWMITWACNEGSGGGGGGGSINQEFSRSNWENQ